MSQQNISVPAHFDGERILLDEPLELEPDTKLIVTILPNHDSERESWLRLSAERLEKAFGDDEPDYPLDLIKEANPEYERK
jgi:hypothetical protein